MKQGKLIGLLILSLLILSACKGYEVTETTPQDTTAEEIINETETSEEETEGIEISEESSEEATETNEEQTAFELFNPDLTYGNVYNGPLYLAGMDWDTENISEEELFLRLDQNGVNYMILFTTPKNDQEAIRTAIENHPSRIIPFTNPGLTETELRTSFTEDSLPSEYKEAFNGLDLAKGIGRLDISSLGISPINSKIEEIYVFASKEQVPVVLEAGVGEAQRLLQELLTLYPETTFLLHVQPEELTNNLIEYTNLLDENENLFYVIDANDILYDEDQGLLKKFSSQDTEDAVASFTEEYDISGGIYISNAVSRYESLISSYPERVVLETNVAYPYGYNEEVYNKMIKAMRTFILKMDEDARENIAYENALTIFGEGI